MNSSSLLGIGTRALAANLTALQVTGNNIANVNTPGYSRQIVQFSATDPRYSAGDSQTASENTVQVARAHDAFIARLATVTGSVAAADAARADKLSMIEQAFVIGPSGVGAAINGVLNGFADIANAPQDASARQLVLSQIDETASRFNAAADQIDLVASGLNDEIASNVDEVNRSAKAIADLNSEIALLQTRGAVPNELLDQRDKLINDLNRVVQTTSLSQPDGSINLFIGGTQALVLGGTSLKLMTTTDEYDPAQSAVRIQTPNGGTSLVDASQLTGGSLSGLMSFQTNDLAAARNQLGRLATATAMLVNEQHHLGLTLSGQFGGDLFSLSTTVAALPSNQNTSSAQLSATIGTDPTQYLATDYRVSVDAGGALTVTRMSDQSVVTPDANGRYDGLTLSFSGAPASGDSFLLRPFAAAARDIHGIAQSPTALAVAAPVTASTPSTNPGDVRVASLQAIGADPNLQAAVTLTFTGANTFDVSGTGAGIPATGLTYVAGQPIQFNGWKLVLSGTPAVGDVVNIAANTAGTRNAQQAQAFLALRDAPVFDGSTLSNGYATVLAQVGARIQSAQFTRDTSQSMAAQAASAEAGVSGVNLDEEAARLLQYQQAYQAAARILQTADTVFKSLISGIGQ